MFCCEHRYEVMVVELRNGTERLLMMIEYITSPVASAWRIHPSRIPLRIKCRHTVNSPVKIDPELGIFKPLRFSLNCRKRLPGLFKRWLSGSFGFGLLT